MKAQNTKVLSTRVPVDVMNTLDELCSKQGVNRSQYLTSILVKEESNVFFKEGGVVKARLIPTELQDMLAAAGVAAIGIFSYNVIQKKMEEAMSEDGKPKFSDTEVVVTSMICALAIAMAGHGLIKAITKE